MNKKAFTLVELIVVITILAILATVAFISFQGYGQSARDGVRLSDMKSMEKVLELYKLTSNTYPTPVNSISITYSGSTAWTQGVFGQTAYTTNASMSNVPTDPVTSLEYPYSVTANGQEYQLAAVLENPITSTITQATYAGTQEAEVYVKGNYNGTYLKVRKGSTTYLLGVPSILTSDIVSSQLLEDIITNKRLVYNGHKNLPASYSGSVYKTDGGFDFGGASYVASDIILFEGDVDDLETNQTRRVDFFNRLQASYSGSVISNQGDITELLSIDSSSSGRASNYVATSFNRTFSTSIPLQEVEPEDVIVLASCPSSPNAEADFIFDSETQTITGNNGGPGGLSGDLVIPCTIGGISVLHIGNDAFSSNSLTGVIIPSTVITIGQKAFRYNQITTITLPNSLTSIGNYAFMENDITSVTIPVGITTLGQSLFYKNKITSLTLPNSLTNIGGATFKYNLLESVDLPSNLTDLGYQAFAHNKLTSVDIPSTLEFIGGQAFYVNELTSVTIPNGVTGIGGEAFRLNNLESITIPNSVTRILNEAFMENDLITATIPNSVYYIGKGAFRDNQLTSINIPEGVTAIYDNTFRQNQLSSVTIPSTVTTIGDLAFYSNQLTTITIPSAVTSIGNVAFHTNKIVSIVINCGLPTFGSSVFSNNGLDGTTNIADPVSCL